MSKNHSTLNDLLLIKKVTSDQICSNLKIRFFNDLIYTFLGDLLISVNPYKQLNIYSDFYIKDLPHIYSIASKVFIIIIN